MGKTATIAAISTAIGEGGIGVIRLSGPEALSVADRIFDSKRGTAPSKQKSFTCQYGWIVDHSSQSQERIDEVLLHVMRAPKSYTCEDMVEISCHGGRVLMQKVLGLCLRQGAELADPGEFTRRAFMNGRIDLLQAEAVLELIRAKSERAHQAASRQLQGSLSKKIAVLRDALVKILGHLEASIDFPEDEIDPMSQIEIENGLTDVQMQLGAILKQSKSSLCLRHALRTVFIGKPNVGKSSLMNAILEKERVMTSPNPGTTRDTIEAYAEVEGYPILLVDTAGLGTPNDPGAEEGMRRTDSEVEIGDLLLFVADGSQALSKEEAVLWQRTAGKSKILVLNKSDEFDEDSLGSYERLGRGFRIIRTSCVHKTGIEELKKQIAEHIIGDAPEMTDEEWIFSVRHLSAIEKARKAVLQALEAIKEGLSLEFQAADARQAMDHLGAVVGAVTTEDILDLVFNEFCIGK